MNALHLQTAKVGTWVVATIIFIMVVISHFMNELYVQQGGKFEIFGKFGILLVFGLVWRWKHIGKIVSILTFIQIIVMLIHILMIKAVSIPYIALLIGLSITFYLTTFSKSIFNYLNKIAE